jgi:predicted permease
LEFDTMTIERWILAVRAKVRAVLGREAMDRELDEELRYHAERKTEQNIARGMTAEQARRVAMVEAGGIEQAKEECRDARGVTWIHDLGQDLQFGLRMLRKSPGFSAIAILTLALGIGANTAIFSLIDALLLRALPVSNPQELVFLQWSANKRPNFGNTYGYGDCQALRTVGNPTGCTLSRPFFGKVRGLGNVFSDVAASGGSVGLALSGNGPTSGLRGMTVSGDYFDTLGVRPFAGRTIEPSDDQASARPVALLSYGYWQSAFGGSLSAIGETIRLNGLPTTIVGVAERRFVGLTPGSAPDIWVPIATLPQLDPRWKSNLDNASTMWLLIVARLQPHVPRKTAESAVSLLFHDEMVHGAQPLSTEGDAPAIALIPAQTGLNGARGQYSTPLFVLMTAVGIVLIIASANIAGLLLARSAARQKEMAVRLALGARRGRIVRQLLTESILLSAMGGVLGALFAIAGVQAIVAFVASGSGQPLGVAVSIDARVLLFTGAIVLLTGIVFGLAPAMRGARVDLTPALKDGVRLAGRGGNRWFHAGNLLVVGQVALTMIVLVGAGLVVRTLQNLRDVDPGFDANNLLNFRINPVLIGYKGAKLDALYRDLQERLGAIPGVTSVSYSGAVLLSGSVSSTIFHLAGTPEKSSIDSDTLEIGPNYFSTMKMSLLAGRDFSSTDFVPSSYEVAIAAATAASAKNSVAGRGPAQAVVTGAVIVNETFVRRYLGNANPLGQRLTYPDAKPSDPVYVIVGVVGDTKYNDLRREIHPTTYKPVTSAGVFELRTAREASALIPAVRSAVAEVDSNLPVSGLITQSEGIDRLLFQERLLARFSSFFGALALALASIGLYGLLSYEVTRRTREIGIRMALGAGPRDVLNGVVGQGVGLAAGGLVIGVAASFGLTRFLGSILYGVRSGDPQTIAAVTAILLLVAFAACLVPARRAMRVDPMVALRHE